MEKNLLFSKVFSLVSASHSPMQVSLMREKDAHLTLKVFSSRACMVYSCKSRESARQPAHRERERIFFFFSPSSLSISIQRVVCFCSSPRSPLFGFLPRADAAHSGRFFQNDISLSLA
jgi:hypothetical protein